LNEPFQPRLLFTIIDRSFLTELRDYEATMLRGTAEKRNDNLPDNDPDKVEGKIRYRTTGANARPDNDYAFLDKDGRITNEGELEQLGLSSHNMTPDQYRELTPTSPLTPSAFAWSRTKVVALKEFVERILHDDPRFMDAQERATIVALHYWEDLEFKEINQRLDITNSKNLFDSTIKHIKRECGNSVSKRAYHQMLLALGEGDMTDQGRCTHALYDFAQETQRAINEELPIEDYPGIERLRELIAAEPRDYKD
jgi:hypothetical protein